MSTNVSGGAIYPIGVGFGVADQIWAVAKRRPESLAITGATQKITYGCLAAHSAILAADFRQRLGGRAGVIAVSIANPVHMISAALAAWKVGCAYLPVDLRGAFERVQLMLEQTAARFIVADNDSDGPFKAWPRVLVPPLPSRTSITLDERMETFPAVGPEDIAYVMYTSGSTGQPKGVAVTQGNLSNLVKWAHSAFNVGESDKVSQFYLRTFDPSVLEIWPCLSAGACLHIVEQSLSIVPERLRDYLCHEQISLCGMPTSVAEQLLGLEWPSNTCLRILYTGGESLRTFPRPELPFQLVNSYGPTECTVLATSGVVPAGAANTGFPSLGKPIPGTQIHILDSNLNPVPDGDRGQICIAGDAVAAGYIGRPELTAERFLTLPSGTRVYLTGDVGRYSPSGDLEFCGRLDDQLKLNGYRIEPEEIVAALRSHRAVAGAAVAVIEEAGGKQLVAYLVLSHPVTVRDILEQLVRRLPNYMMPDQFVKVAKLPTNSRGKVDRTRLPKPDSKNTIESHPRQLAVKTVDVQAYLLDFWRDLFAASEVGIDDDFFGLGGTSLSAARLMAGINNRFGRQIPVSALLDTPTVRSLTSRVQDSDNTPASNIVSLNTGRYGRPVFFVHPIGGEVLIYKELASELGSRPAYGIRAAFDDQREVPSVPMLARRYLTEIQAVEKDGPYYLSGYSAGGAIAFEMAAQLQAAGKTAVIVLIEPVMEPSATGLIRQGKLGHGLRILLNKGHKNLRYLNKVGISRYFGDKIRGLTFRTQFILPGRPILITQGDTRQHVSPTELWIYYAVRRYMPRAASCKIVLFRTSDVYAEALYPDPERLAALGTSLAVYDVPGDHLTLMLQPHVAVLAKKLAACLDSIDLEYAQCAIGSARHCVAGAS